jgi:hypothetical protein
VILFHDVVQVPDGSATASAPEFAGLFQLGNDFRIRRVPVHIDVSVS